MSAPYKFVADGLVIAERRWYNSDSKAWKALARYARRYNRGGTKLFEVYRLPHYPESGTIKWADPIFVTQFEGAAAGEWIR